MWIAKTKKSYETCYELNERHLRKIVLKRIVKLCERIIVE